MISSPSSYVQRLLNHPLPSFKQARSTGFILLVCLTTVAPPILFAPPLLAQQTPSEARIIDAVYLNQQGWTELSQGNLKQALATFQKALAIFREEGAKGGEGNALNNIGTLYLYNFGDYPKAMEYFQQALPVRRAAGDREGEWITLSEIGQTYIELGNYEEGLKFYLQALPIVRELKQTDSERYMLDYIAKGYYRMGDYRQALDYYQQSLVMHQASPDYDSMGTTLANIGVVYVSLGEYARGQEAYEKALDIYNTRLKTHIGPKAVVLNNMAGLYFSLGQYQRSAELAKQALKIFDSYRGSKKADFPNLNLLYESLSKYARPTEFGQNLAMRREAGNAFSGKTDVMERGAGATRNNLGQILFNQGQYNEALKLYQEALKTYRELADRSGEAITLNNIGSVYDTLNQYDQALKFYQQALEKYRKLNDRVGEGVALSNIGFVYDRQKQPQQAVKLYQEALVIHRAVGDRPSESITLNNLGRLQLTSGNAVAAADTFFKAIEVLESLRPGLNDASKVSIFETQSRTYGLLQQALVAQNKHEAALEIAERGRARAFVERLAQRLTARVPGQQRVPESLVKPIQIEEIKRIARDQKATLVEYSIIEDQQLFIWVVKPTGEVGFRKVSLQGKGQSPVSLEELVSTGRESIGVRGFSFNEGTAIVANAQLTSAAQNQKLQQMHQLLIQPIADLLPANPTDRVIFIPQRSLFLVPFAALQDSKGKYLIEQHTILTAPSVQVLALTRQQKQQRATTQISFTKDNTLLVGNPTMPSIRPNLVDPARVLPSLPGAEKEVKRIAELLGAEAVIGNQATKPTVVAQMVKARLIHLATHGLLEDLKRVGVPGAIALAPSGQDDGMLLASEILDLPLVADLVVLSACDTGRGRITGDGVIGLSRSLLTAGVPSVIVSLWKVPDEPTAMLMTEFYKNLLQKTDKAQALRQAMLATLQQYPDPKSWAAFTLIGEAE